MAQETPLDRAQSELEEGMGQAKCRQCGCMHETLEKLRLSLSGVSGGQPLELTQNVETWLGQMKPIKYACLGCAH